MTRNTDTSTPEERRFWRPRDAGLHEYEFERNRPENRHARRAAMKKSKTKKSKVKGGYR